MDRDVLLFLAFALAVLGTFYLVCAAVTVSYYILTINK